MTKKEWQQYSLDGGDVLVVPRRPRNQPKEKKPPDERGAVLSFLERTKIAFDAGEELPSFRELTNEHQISIYYGIMASNREKQKEYQQQWRAEELGLTSETFYLDQEVELEKSCGCGRNFVRQTVTMRSGRKQHRGLTRLLVNEYCSSCGFESSGREYQFWVQNSQIVRKE